MKNVFDIKLTQNNAQIGSQIVRRLGEPNALQKSANKLAIDLATVDTLNLAEFCAAIIAGRFVSKTDDNCESFIVHANSILTEMGFSHKVESVIVSSKNQRVVNAIKVL